MTYEKQTWTNDEPPPLSAARLNHMEDGIAAAVPTDVGEGVTVVSSESIGGEVTIGPKDIQGYPTLRLRSDVLEAPVMYTHVLYPDLDYGDTVTINNAAFSVSAYPRYVGPDIQPNHPNALARKDYVDGKAVAVGFESIPDLSSTVAAGETPTKDEYDALRSDVSLLRAYLVELVDKGFASGAFKYQAPEG